MDRRTIGIPQGQGTIPDLKNLIVDIGSDQKVWYDYANITEAMIEIGNTSQSLYDRLDEYNHAVLPD